MAKLIVTVLKLNKRKCIPATFPDPENIIGFVKKGFSFEGVEVKTNTNPAMGKWYVDRDGTYYWGGGLVEEQVSSQIKILDWPVNVPSNCQMGIDLSHHNSKADWNAFKNAGVKFAYIKISDGSKNPDGKAMEHAQNAKAYGLKIGYYHFCRPDARQGGTVVSDALDEANDSLKIIADLPKADLPLVLDLENDSGANWDSPLNKQDYLLWVTTFINQIKAANESDPVLYSRKEYLDRKLPKDHQLGIYKLWISYYPDRPDYNNVPCPIGWNDWAVWQFTENGKIGLTNPLDINVLKDNSFFID